MFCGLLPVVRHVVWLITRKLDISRACFCDEAHMLHSVLFLKTSAVVRILHYRITNGDKQTPDEKQIAVRCPIAQQC